MGMGEGRQNLPGGFQAGQGPQAGPPQLWHTTVTRKSAPGWRGGGGGVLAGGTGTSPPSPPAHGKWSLCSVSGSGLLSCQDPGFPAPARSFPLDF